MALTLITFGPLYWEPIPGSKRGRRLIADRPVYLNGALLCVLPLGLESDGMSFPLGVRLTWDDPWHVRYEDGAWLHDGLLELQARGEIDLKKWQIDWLAEGGWRTSGVSALETWIFTNAIRTRR